MLKRFAAVLIMVGLFFALAGCSKESSKSANQTPPPNETKGQQLSAIRVWGGTPSGAWGPLMINISELMKKTFPGVPVSVEPAGGSSAILALAQGKGELSIAVSFTSAQAYRGVPPFKEKSSGLRQIMGLFDSPMQVVALADSHVEKVEDLKGKSVNFGQKGMNAEVLGNEILKAYGMKVQDVKAQYLGLGDGSDSMKNGQTVAAFRSTAVPTSDIMDLANARNIKLLGLTDQVIQDLIAKNPGLTKYTIPADTYKGVGRPINTVSAPAALLVPAGLPDDVVYKMVKAIVDNMRDLTVVYNQMKEVTPEKMTADLGIPFHPGAIKYYKEKGWMK